MAITQTNDLGQTEVLVEVLPGGWRGIEPGEKRYIEADTARTFIARGFLKEVEDTKPKPKKFNHQRS